MNALLIDSKDNVVVVTCPVDEGSNISFIGKKTEAQIIANTTVPVYHKIAICDIMGGESVIKNGHIIGKASEDIKAGDHVHCHNVVSSEEKEPG